MIGSLLPSFFPTASHSVQDGSHADGGGRVGRLSRLGDEAVIAQPERRDGPDFAGRDFVHDAKHMIRGALKAFTHDIKSSLHDLGFKSDMVMKLAHEVMQGAKDALRSGADFTANLIVAAMSQITATGPSGTASAFSLVASGIEVTVNHSTGSVEVNATKVEIQNLLLNAGAAPVPQLVDFQDTDAGQASTLADRLLALSDLGDALDGEETDAALLASQLAALPETAPAADETAPAEDIAAAGTEAPEDAAATDDGTPDFAGVSRITIRAFERYIDAAGQDFTYLRFDAVVPLTPPRTDAVAAAPQIVQAAPVPVVTDSGLELVA